MSVVTPRPPRSDDRSEVDDRSDAEALEALIEEARRRARRRRRAYAACLAAAAAALLGFYAFNHGGGATRPRTGVEHSSGAAGVSSEEAFGRWRPVTGLEGADLTALAFDPRHPRIVFAAADNAGVFKSTDGGRSWRPLSIAPTVMDLCCLLVDPQHPRTVYAGTAEGVFTSTDGGASWPTVVRPRVVVTALALDPADAQTIFAGGVDGLFRSTDGGASWRHVLPGAAVVRAIAVDPTDPQRVYAGASSSHPYSPPNYTGQTGVFASSDGGRSWHPAGLQDSEVTSLAIDPTRPRILYAVTRGSGLFKSADRGGSWRAIGPEDLAETLLLDPRDPDTVYAGTAEATVRRSIFKSTDGGRTWRVLDVGRRADPLAFDPRTAGTLYAGDRGTPSGVPGGGILKSSNGGRSWRELSAGPMAAQVITIAVDPRNPGTAYAAVRNRGVFKRTAGGWHAANKGLKVYPDVFELAVDPSNPAIVYVATDSGVFKSTDGAASWPAAGSGVLDRSLLAVRDPQHPDTLYYAGEFSGGVRKSTDGGASWQDSTLTDTPVHVHDLALALDPNEPATLYAGTDAGLFTSTNGAASWQALRGRLANTEIYAVAVDPQKPQTIYAGTATGVFVSTDGGATWSSLSRGLPVRTYDTLAIDPAAHIVYAGALGAGIYELRLDR